MNASASISPVKVPILMYHSISEEQGPTSIAPAVFEAQMHAIATAGWNVAPLSAYAAWRLRGGALPLRTLIVTFDDGYQDFADAAFPILERFKFPATVFVPTRLVGGGAGWGGAASAGRPIMNWDTIRALASKGIEFAPHGRAHIDLATLDQSALVSEVAGSGEDLQSALGTRSRHFAPPFGRTSPAAQAVIQANYDISVGVGLGVATRQSPAHDAPRIEMFYYRNIKQWASFLAGTGDAYLAVRQLARTVRHALTARQTY